jgi:hypothetical protein
LEVTAEVRDSREVEGVDFGEPLKEAREEREGWVTYSERELVTVGDGE